MSTANGSEQSFLAKWFGHVERGLYGLKIAIDDLFDFLRLSLWIQCIIQFVSEKRTVFYFVTNTRIHGTC
jgi:hypothetical protein